MTEFVLKTENAFGFEKSIYLFNHTNTTWFTFVAYHPQIYQHFYFKEIIIYLYFLQVCLYIYIFSIRTILYDCYCQFKTNFGQFMFAWSISYGNPSGKFIYRTPIAVFLFWRMCKNNLKSGGIWVFRTLELRLFM